jgi:flagellin-specific chaperone FliS
MRSATAYADSQTITLDGDRAFEELYTRLARWAAEAAHAEREHDPDSAIAKIERCVALLGYMNQAIDLSENYEVATAVLSLHKFAIGALVKAKAQPGSGELGELPKVFLLLAEIFGAIRTGKQSVGAARRG